MEGKPWKLHYKRKTLLAVYYALNTFDNSCKPEDKQKIILTVPLRILAMISQIESCKKVSATRATQLSIINALDVCKNMNDNEEKIDGKLDVPSFDMLMSKADLKANNVAAGKHISVLPKKQARNIDVSQVVKNGKEYLKASTLGPHGEIHICKEEGNVQCGELKAFTWPFNRELSRS